MNTKLLYLKQATDRCRAGAELARTRWTMSEPDSRMSNYYFRLWVRWDALADRYSDRFFAVAEQLLTNKQPAGGGPKDMGYWEEKRRREDARAERQARKDKEFEAQKLAEHKAWLAERFPKDQTVKYRGFGLVTDNHGYTWTIAGLGYANILGLRAAKECVNAYYRDRAKLREWEERAEL